MEVTTWVHRFGGLIERMSDLWVTLGNLETRLHMMEAEASSLRQPIFICGLARSGSTILLELLAEHSAVASHRYRDFPALYTPIWWNWFLDRASGRPIQPKERAHKDGIMVTPDSPEAMEEVLWMKFFPGAHDPRQSNVLDRNTSHPDFEKFYRDHIAKLLKVRGGTRYLSKGNYNVCRMEYISKIFPDALFVVPLRNPITHIASLMKQHRLFCKEEEQDRRVLIHMQRVGHLEFGLDRRPINFNDSEVAERVLNDWEEGHEVRGWARYWANVYDFVLDRLEADDALRERTLIVHLEDLCRRPKERLAALYDHCALAVSTQALKRQAQRLAFPQYYKPSFSDEDIEEIQRNTAKTVLRAGALV